MEEDYKVIGMVIVGRLLGWLAICSVVYMGYALYTKNYDPMMWPPLSQCGFVFLLYWFLPTLDPTNDDY